MEPKYNVTFPVDGMDDFEIFMSAGLIRKLISKVNQVDDVSAIYLDAELQEDILLECLADRDEYGNIKDEKEPHRRMNALSKQDGDKLMKWIGGHMLDFFIGGAEGVKEAVELQQKTAQSLIDSSNGMEDSRNTKPSAGSSEQSQAEPT